MGLSTVLKMHTLLSVPFWVCLVGRTAGKPALLGVVDAGVLAGAWPGLWSA